MTIVRHGLSDSPSQFKTVILRWWGSSQEKVQACHRERYFSWNWGFSEADGGSSVGGGEAADACDMLL